MRDLKNINLQNCIDNRYLKNFPTSFKSIIQLFEEQVCSCCDETAVIFENEELSYGDLSKKAERLAIYLKAQGVFPGTIVGLYLENCIELAIAILGILKAGGAYLPLDPHYPIGRVKSMVEEAKPSIILTRRDLSIEWMDKTIRMIEIEKCLEDPCEKKISETMIFPDQMAYLIYTSGSTGSPKGIMISHESLVEAIQVRKNIYPESPIALLSGSISFDPSILIFFYTLTTGGTLCIPKNDQPLDIQKTIDLIVKQNINFLLSVPSFYAMIMEKSQQLSSLKHVSLAGEPIPQSLPVQHAAYASQSSLFNEYGPSEYAIGTTWAQIYDPNEKIFHKISAGKAFKKAKVYILDDNFQELATNVKGEIFIGGIGLAIGYLYKEELTKEKFINISLQENPSTRLYRSGDFGRISAQGDLEFLGRMDHQVKIRGYRVELGEIEQIICQYEGVEKAAVIVKESDNANKRLIAYFSSPLHPFIEKDLKMYLRNRLPEQMLPSALIQLQQFPYTPNGKIDRERLTQLELSYKDGNDDFLPDSQLQQELIRIWKEVLKQEHISIHDHFFEIGGDSVHIACVQTKIHSELGFDVPIVDLFAFPSIFKLSARLLRSNGMLFAKTAVKRKKVDFNQFKKREESC